MFSLRRPLQNFFRISQNGVLLPHREAGAWKHINKMTKQNNYKFSISFHQTYVKFLTVGFFISFTFYKRVSLENYHLDNFGICNQDFFCSAFGKFES